MGDAMIFGRLSERAGRLAAGFGLAFALAISPMTVRALDGAEAVDAEATAVASEAPEEVAETTAEPLADTTLPNEATESAQPEGEANDQGEIEAQEAGGVEAPADAASVTEGTYFLNCAVATDRVLDAAGKNPKAGANVSSWAYNGGNNQQWDVKGSGTEGWYRLYLHGSGSSLLLGVAPEGGNVLVTAATGAGDETLWAFVSQGSGYALVNRKTGLALEVQDGSTNKGANVRVGERESGSARQTFELLAANVTVTPSSTVAEGAYLISPAANGGLVVEVRGASTANGANISLYAPNGKEHQKLYLESDGHGFFRIWVMGTGKLIVPTSNSRVSGTNVVQKAKAGTDLELWAPVDREVSGKSGVAFVNKVTGLALCAKSATSGGNVNAARNDASIDTLFTLVRKPLLTAGIVEIHPRTTSKVSLDVKGAASSGNANLLLWTDSDALNQRFELVAGSEVDQWRIRSASSGGWITDTGSGVQQRGTGSTAVSPSNTWRVVYKGGGYSLISMATGKAIDMKKGKTSKGTNIITYAPNGKDSQHFTFVSAALVPAGYYFFQSGLGTYLDIPNSSTAEGANVQTWQKTNTFAQYFTLEKSGSSYRIKNTHSGKYLTAASDASGANVTQCASNSSNAQKWNAVIADGGMVGFVGVGSGMALDVKGASKANGANVQIATPNQGAGQAWKLIKSNSAPFTGYQLRAVNKANASRSSTKYFICVDKSSHKVVVLTGGNGSWEPYRIMPCTVGASATPTVEGSFTIGSRGLSFGSGYTCWYWTQFYKDYLFHSIVYNPGSRTSVQDGRMGINASHGCVRMYIGDAKWIYNNIPSGTRVLVYR